LWKSEEELLKREYENFQRYLHGDRSVPLYSVTKQQAERLLRRLKGETQAYWFEGFSKPCIFDIPLRGGILRLLGFFKSLSLSSC
jgi:hypothetical protein